MAYGVTSMVGCTMGEHSYGAHGGSYHSSLGVGVESLIMGRDRLYLWLPPLVMAPLDMGMTLWGQPPEYWGGACTLREDNPLAAQLLLIPAAFLAAGVAWLALVVGLVTVLPRPAALTISVAVSQAHAWAAGNWVRALLPYPHVFLAVLFLASAALVVMACERSRSPAGRPPNP
jgi:hypothetical protein